MGCECEYLSNGAGWLQLQSVLTFSVNVKCENKFFRINGILLTSILHWKCACWSFGEPNLSPWATSRPAPEASRRSNDASYTRGNAPCLLEKNQPMGCKRRSICHVAFLDFKFSTIILESFSYLDDPLRFNEHTSPSVTTS